MAAIDLKQLVGRLNDFCRRALEAAAGMGAAAPGMPMASPPLDTALRDLVYVWAREGCPAPNGRPQCAPAGADTKKP